MLILILLGVLAVWGAAASVVGLRSDAQGYDGFAERNRPGDAARIR